MSKIQEYNWSCKKISKNQLEPGKSSILGPPPKIPTLIDAKNNRLPIKRISPTQMEERKKKGLCYNCDEKWGRGHKCTRSCFLWVQLGIVAAHLHLLFFWLGRLMVHEECVLTIDL